MKSFIYFFSIVMFSINALSYNYGRNTVNGYVNTISSGAYGYNTINGFVNTIPPAGAQYQTKKNTTIQNGIKDDFVEESYDDEYKSIKNIRVFALQSDFKVNTSNYQYFLNLFEDRPSEYRGLNLVNMPTKDSKITIEPWQWSEKYNVEYPNNFIILLFIGDFDCKITKELVTDRFWFAQEIKDDSIKGAKALTVSLGKLDPNKKTVDVEIVKIERNSPYVPTEEDSEEDSLEDMLDRFRL